jgi:hypothetical protein
MGSPSGSLPVATANSAYLPPVDVWSVESLTAVSEANHSGANAEDGSGSNGGSSSKSTSAEREIRYLDQMLFKAEMKLNQATRTSNKANMTINECKMGVLHLSNLLFVNEKLLSNLPSSKAPHIRSDEDIARVLSWCEERILAINESMVLDNSTKAPVTDDSLPLQARQMELAALIEVCTCIYVVYMNYRRACITVCHEVSIQLQTVCLTFRIILISDSAQQGSGRQISFQTAPQSAAATPKTA